MTMRVYPDSQSLAVAAAKQTITLLRQAITDTGSGIWVLAGGSTPLEAYQVIADRYIDAIDWSKVTILLGDERIAPLDSADSNWHQIEQALLRQISKANLLRPRSDLPLAEAVDDYRLTLEQLTSNDEGYPIFDVVWLGVGDDGHTLSLFPGHPQLDDATTLVLPVEDSPKPPNQRLTLGIGALKASKHLLVLASGHAKSETITKATESIDLPIARAVKAVNESGGQVTWLFDKAAASQLP